MSIIAGKNFTTTDIEPYFSVFIMKNHDAEPAPIYKIIKNIKDAIVLECHNITWNGADVDRTSSGKFITISFSEKRHPGWTNDTSIVDTLNHYFTVAISNTFYILHFSDPEIRDIALSSIKDINIAAVERELLNYVFMKDNDVTMLWLHGIHAKNGNKPDTKAITGQNLRDSLDPIGDQTYAYNATRIRTRVLSSEQVFGLNLKSSFFWFKKLRSWSELLDISEYLTNEIKFTKGSSQSPIDVLSHPMSNMNGVTGAFDISPIDPDDPFWINLSPRNSKLLSLIKNNYVIELRQTNPNNDSLIRLGITHIDQGKLKFYIGEIEVEPTINDGQIKFIVRVTKKARGRSRQLNSFCQMFNNPENVRVWYESGHAITDGLCYEVKYRDVTFNGFYWGHFKGFDICKEKPLNQNGNANLSAIGLNNDNSLFSWVVASAFRKGKKGELGHFELSRADDWLICDDGSGEIADFIHLTTIGTRHHVTFVHVKAAKSDSINRNISVGAHEIVISQAIKNIRYIDRDILIRDVSSKLASNTKRIWNGANLPTTGLLNYLASLPGRLNMHVVVVQPHTIRTRYRSGGGGKPRKQLDVLLVNARQVIGSMNASFHVIGYR